MKPKVYIDGKEGTTGIEIYDRLSAREDIDLLLIDEDRRKDTAERAKFINEADLTFLCLPDDAAVEAVSLVENPKVKIIDTSTAHRISPGWVYGFAELSKEQREAIAGSYFTANPGCHATGFIVSVYPLVKAGIIPDDMAVTCFSLTGYSGGGKKMIAEYESPDKPDPYFAPRIYGLNLKHKHLPEMRRICGLKRDPVFVPVVDDYYKGMATTIMLDNSVLAGDYTTEDIYEALAAHYDGEKLIKVREPGYDEPMISAGAFAGKDTLEIIINGNGSQTIVTALFDNLGKGASGAAVQNMNLMLGFEETEGLNM